MRLSALSCLFALAVALHGESITSSTPLIIGGFNLARGGIESLASGGDPKLATEISNAYSGATFQFTNTLTPAFLSGVNTVILGAATDCCDSITPLSTSEQGALMSFILAGGNALIFSDNNTLSSSAAASNASLLSPFGVTSAGTLYGATEAPLLNTTGPLTGPLTPVTEFTTNYPGYFTSTGAGTVLAEYNGDPGEAAVDYFAPGVLGPGSGSVYLFSDSNCLFSYDADSDTDENLILNALSFPEATSVAPEPGTTVLFGLGLVSIAGLCSAIRRKRVTNA